MISVENLTKIYVNKKLRVTALDDVSFTLPANGLVFIVGKSGSGKSTLLNLLGALDEATAGEICVNGLNFSDMKGDSGFDAYRNSRLGFVFQDFHLISRLNVARNVQLALNIAGECAKGEKYDKRVLDALKQVGLEGFEERYPAQLSGGQQQRVAIARAIVKDPELILADEPTGNLDSVTSRQILQLLKGLSKDRLVVVVSHSLDAANEYADRIIELGEGRIVRDVSRSAQEGETLVDGDVITLPDGRLTDEQLAFVNEAIKSRSATIKRCHERFEDTSEEETPDKEEVEEEIRDENVEEGKEGPHNDENIAAEESAAKHTSSDKRGGRRSLPAKETARLGFRLMNIPSLIVSVLATALTTVMFVICLMMYMFDGSSVFANRDLNSGGVVILQKDLTATNSLDSLALNKIYRVQDGDEDAIRALGYEGKIYKLYNMAVINDAALYSGLLKCEMKRQDKLYATFYADETLGVLVADMEYLKKQFGDFEVLAGKLDDKPYGIILTDYFADGLLKANPSLVTAKQYEGLLGRGDDGSYMYYVNAVIKTDYKERHAKLFKMYNEALADGLLSEKDKNELAASDEYAAFLTDAQTRLNIAYSIDENYIEATRQKPFEARSRTYIFNSNVFDGEGTLISDDFSGGLTIGRAYDLPPIEKGEAYISRNFYNQLYGTHVTSENTSEFEPKTIKIVDYDASDIFKQNPISEITLHIKGLWGEYGCLYLGDDDFAYLRERDVFAYSLVLGDTEGIDKVLDGASKLGYVPNAAIYSDLLLVARVMKVYSDLFLTLALILLAVGLVVLVAFAVRSVRSRTYEIGILRSLGAGAGSVAGIFLLQMLFAGILVCVVSIIGQASLVTVANGLITSGLATFMHNGTFKGMTLIGFDPAVMAISLAAVIGITLLSAIIPIIKLARIKPMEILRRKE